MSDIQMSDLQWQIHIAQSSFILEGSRAEFRRVVEDETGEDVLLIEEYQDRIISLRDSFHDGLDGFFLPDGF
jgi:hypothetical protein